MAAPEAINICTGTVARLQKGQNGVFGRQEEHNDGHFDTRSQ